MHSWRLQDMSSRCLEDVFKTCLQDVLKTSSRPTNVCWVVSLIRDNDVKQFKSLRYYLQKGIIKKYNVIINRKNFYHQPIDSDIKRYE